jgi:hypothetical protein
MAYRLGRSDQIATHQQRPDADFLVHADLEPHGMAGAREQLWVKQVDERRFVMRNLPYFTYGIALGDEVSTDEALTIDGVMRRSGHRLLRVALECDAAERFNQGSTHFSITNGSCTSGAASATSPSTCHHGALYRASRNGLTHARAGSLRYEDG